jgi:hypothetical protein
MLQARVEKEPQLLHPLKGRRGIASLRAKPDEFDPGSLILAEIAAVIGPSIAVLERRRHLPKIPLIAPRAFIVIEGSLWSDAFRISSSHATSLRVTIVPKI